jgi:hypothetical protein
MYKTENSHLTESNETDTLVPPYQIVNDEYLMTDLNLTKSFIDRNAKAMGSFGRPRKFFLQYVMKYLNGLALRSMDKVNSKAVRQNAVKHQVNKLFETVLSKRSIDKRN